ncbi:MAG: flavodoxin family protein [Spirochaetes bacterium]|nr:flavodoxin family protein [Spirochaetota bacterium]
MDVSKIKVLSIHASPKADSLSGFTNRLLTKKLFTNIEPYDIFLSKNIILPCNACSFCSNLSECSIKDSMTEYYNLIKEADILIVSFPLYFSTVPAQLKLLIDRAQLFWEMKKRGENIKRKRGIIIITGGHDYNEMFSCAEKTMRHFFTTINAEYDKHSSVFIPSTDNYTMEENRNRAENYISQLTIN